MHATQHNAQRRYTQPLLISHGKLIPLVAHKLVKLAASSKLVPMLRLSPLDNLLDKLVVMLLIKPSQHAALTINQFLKWTFPNVKPSIQQEHGLLIPDAALIMEVVPKDTTT